MKVNRVCIDSDTLQDYLCNKKDAVALLAGLEKTADCTTTLFNVFELFCFAQQSGLPEENTNVIQELLDRLTVVGLTPTVCRQAAILFTELLKTKKKADIRDLFVGLIAKQQNCLLVTNTKERYENIPGLKIYK